ncbi:type IV pilin [Natrinema sp. LN54]|uniref:type IV pilin n=1 Tax=Natrinema sp. LN54 TaxID=3458705 RepID=UPI00403681B5
MTRQATSNTTTDGETRAISPIIGVLLLVALTVCLAAVIAVGVGAWTLESPGSTATFELSADGDQSSISIEHVAGDAVDVEALSVTVAVNGTELAEQPPVPYAGASGFNGTPEGPFNSGADSEWTVGERASLSVADTNSPPLARGDSVTVTLAIDGRRVATLEATAT